MDDIAEAIDPYLVHRYLFLFTNNLINIMF